MLPLFQPRPVSGIFLYLCLACCRWQPVPVVEIVLSTSLRFLEVTQALCHIVYVLDFSSELPNDFASELSVLSSGPSVGILTRTDRPKRPLMSVTDSNSKTSQATHSNPFNKISDTRLYKLTQTAKQRLMNRLV